MQSNHNNQWVEIVAKLTLARSILGSAIADVDDIVSEIEAGRIHGAERSLSILENAIKDLMADSESIGNVATDIPESFLGLNRSHHCTCCQPENADHILSQSTLFDISQFVTSLERQVG